MEKEQGYRLSNKGMLMMAKVLLRAEKAGLLTPGCITDANIKEYIQTLADHDEIWDEESADMDKDMRKVMLAFVLLKVITPAPISELN